MNTTARITPSTTIGSDSFSNTLPFSHAEMAVGIEVRIEQKISSDWPLPTPRRVMYSPIHISSVDPAVSVSTIRMNTRAFRSGRASEPPSAEPLWNTTT